MKLPEWLIVTLACGHSRERKRKTGPEEGQIIYCMRCHGEAAILTVVEQYHLQCEGCRYGRLFGRDRVGAGLAGTRHRRKRPDHPMVLYVGEEVVRRWRVDAPELFAKSLPKGTPAELDPPPF